MGHTVFHSILQSMNQICHFKLKYLTGRLAFYNISLYVCGLLMTYLET